MTLVKYLGEIMAIGYEVRFDSFNGTVYIAIVNRTGMKNTTTIKLRDSWNEKRIIEDLRHSMKELHK